jgi:hypothetical protein
MFHLVLPGRVIKLWQTVEDREKIQDPVAKHGSKLLVSFWLLSNVPLPANAVKKKPVLMSGFRDSDQIQAKT